MCVCVCAHAPPRERDRERERERENQRHAWLAHLASDDCKYIASVIYSREKNAQDCEYSGAECNTELSLPRPPSPSHHRIRPCRLPPALPSLSVSWPASLKPVICQMQRFFFEAHHSAPRDWSESDWFSSDQFGSGAEGDELNKKHEVGIRRNRPHPFCAVPEFRLACGGESVCAHVCVRTNACVCVRMRACA